MFLFLLVQPAMEGVEVRIFSGGARRLLVFLFWGSVSVFSPFLSFLLLLWFGFVLFFAYSLLAVSLLRNRPSALCL